MQPPILELTNVSKIYGTTEVVSEINLSVYEREFFSVIGPSGSGKSTILKMIAGVVSPSRGCITFRGQNVSVLSPDRNGIVMVWQSLALFPHMDVQGNIEFGLLVRGVSPDERNRRVSHFLELVGLKGFERRRIHELSGGEQQRVALARALVVEPNIVLLDEPLGGLDKHIRGRLLAKLREIHRTTSVTFVLVTHDQAEALSSSSRVAVLNRGKIEQIGDPTEVSLRPMSSFVAQFVGNKNVVAASVLDISQGVVHVVTPVGRLAGSIPGWLDVEISSGMSVAYVVDAYKVLVGNAGSNRISGRIDTRAISGGVEVLDVIVPDLGNFRCERVVTVDGNENLPEKVELSWDATDAYVIPNP
jgi:ABC-type Fe3+/spermidine/putrescine transport system ATPase subunit